MKVRPLVLVLIIMITTSIIPVSQANAKLSYGGKPDLTVHLVFDYAFRTGLQNPNENFNLVIEHVENLPVFVKDIMLHEIREELVKQADKIGNEYIQYVSAQYDDEKQLTVIIATHPSYDEYKSPLATFKSVPEGRMSAIYDLSIQISVYGSFGQNYMTFVDQVEYSTLNHVQSLAAQAEEILNKHRDQIIAGTFYGEGFAKVPVDQISMQMTGDLVRIWVHYGENRKFIEEIKTGTGIAAASPVNSIGVTEVALIGASTAVGLVGTLFALRLKGKGIATRYCSI